MRKRVINHVADTIFWYILYFLPVLAYLFFLISAPFRDTSIDGSGENGVNSVVTEEVIALEADSEELPYIEYQRVNIAVNYSNSFTSSLNTAFGENKAIFTVLSFWVQKPGSTSRQSVTYPCMIYYRNYSTTPFNSAPGGTYINLASNYTFYDSTFSFNVPIGYNLYIDDDIVIKSYDLSTGTAGSVLLTFNNDYVTTETVYEFGSLPETPEAPETPEVVSVYDFNQFVNNMGFEFAADNIIVNTLGDIFGTDGIMPMFDNETPFIIFAWFIGVYLLHLLVDFLLFIPRIAHKWMKDCTGGD